MDTNEPGREPTEPTDAVRQCQSTRMLFGALWQCQCIYGHDGAHEYVPELAGKRPFERPMPGSEVSRAEVLRMSTETLLKAEAERMPDTPAPDEVAGWRMTPEQFEAEIARQAAEIKRLEEDRDGWARAHHEIGSACEFTANKNTALSARVAELEAAKERPSAIEQLFRSLTRKGADQ